MTNEVLETIKKRRSVRAYKPDAVPQELLDAVLEAGTYAPTGRGQQSPVIIAVSAAEYRKKIAELNAAVMGKDGDHRFREILHRFYVVRVDDGAGRGVKFR